MKQPALVALALSERGWLIVGGAAAMIFATVVVLGYVRHWSWTGLPERRYIAADGEEVVGRKTLWDWLQLLVVPLALAIGAFVLNEYQSTREQDRIATEAKREQHRDAETQQQELLSDYFSSMSSLFLRGLGEPHPGDRLTSAARSVTFGVLPRLDPGRKRQVFIFLHDAGLMHQAASFRTFKHGWWLTDADFSNVDLTDISLEGEWLTDLNFTGADFSGANLSGSYLSDMNFEDANFSEASFERASVWDSNFTRANLTGIDFSSAKTEGLTLRSATLKEANFYFAKVFRNDLMLADISDANFEYADVRGSDFENANVDSANFESAEIRNSDFVGASAANAGFAGATLETATSQAQTSEARRSRSRP